MRTKVLLLSQQRLLGESICSALANSADVEFLPPVRGISEAIESIHLLHPDVLLLDINPALFGIPTARDLQTACPNCKILVLACHSDPIAQTQLALAGVKGVVSKDIGLVDLVWAIMETASGHSVFLQNGAPVSTDIPHAYNHDTLTNREAEVLELVAKGFANKQIAGELGISIKTVEKHRQRVMCKLQAHETAGLTWRAICMGVARAA